MIQQRDLHRYYQSDFPPLDNDQADEIIRNADQHLVQSGYVGTFIMPLLYAITGYASSIATDHTALYFSLAAILVTASIVRWYTSLHLKSSVLQNRRRWQRFYFFSTITSGCCWGILAAYFLYSYNVSWAIVVILYVTAGIAGGSVLSFSNWMRLNQVYLLLLFLPLIFVSFAFQDKNLTLIGILSIVSLAYNFSQVKMGNRIYWQSLINTHLLEIEVAARKKSQTVLQQERDAFMTGPVMLFTWQHAENLPIDHVSENVFEILGYTANEFIDGSVRYADIVHPDDLDRVLGELTESLDSTDTFYTHKPYRLITRSNTVVWVLDSTTLIRNSNNEVTHYNGYLVDVTATVQMEKEIADTRTRLQAITENVPGVIYQSFIDSDGKYGINYVSPKLNDIFGLDILDDPFLYYQEFTRNIHKDDLKSFMNSIENAVKNLVPWKWQGRYVKPSGEIVWFEGQSTPTFGGKDVIFNGILIDITAVKTLEAEKREAEIQLHRAQKMEAIGMMAGGVAHDLNNILSGIISYPELMLLQLPQESKLRTPIEAIRESGKRAATVVADLLTVARGAATVREAHDINILICEYLHSPEYSKLCSLHPDISCTQALDAESSVISCSPMHIKKTVMNLLTNAMEAVGERGNISVSTCSKEIDGHPDMVSGTYLLLAIRDDGPGIARENIDHIFEPFYTKKVMGRSGTGLGLTVVWNTVQDHNGHIVVKSTPTGTSFQLYFPISHKPAVQPDSDETTHYHTTKKEHILVVDDEAQLRDIATRILGTLGYKVDSVSSGEAAVAFTAKHSVDLIIIDMLMAPGIDGQQTYEKIVQRHPGQKAIIVSGFSENNAVKETIRLGANGFIRKPYSISELGRLIQTVLNS